MIGQCDYGRCKTCGHVRHGELHFLYQIPLDPIDSVNIATAGLSYLSLFGVTAPLSCLPFDDQIWGLVCEVLACMCHVG